jgi:hypothetical protein
MPAEEEQFVEVETINDNQPAATPTPTMPAALTAEVQAFQDQFKGETDGREVSSLLPGLRTSRASRLKLTGRDLDKVRIQATEALPSKFEHYLPTKGMSGLEEAYDLQLRTFQFAERLKAYDMAPTFTILRSFKANGFVEGDGDPVDLLTSTAKVSVEEVRKSNLFYRRWGKDDSWLQDLDWTDSLLENSSEDSLRNQLMERLSDVPDSERGGPLTYIIMMQIVTSIRPESIETLIQSFRGLSLQHESFAGENVDRINQLIRGSLSRLTMVDAVPHDIYRVVCGIYQTSTTPEFNNKFQLLANLHELGQPTYITDYKSLINRAEEEYRVCNSNGTWCAASKMRTPKKAAFMAGEGGDIKCFNCGKKGHIARECNSAPKGGKDINNPLQVAPNAGDPHTKEFKNRSGQMVMKKWCAKCGIGWNNTHHTKDHRTRSEMVAANGAANDAPPTAAAAAGGAPETAVGTTGAPATTGTRFVGAVIPAVVIPAVEQADTDFVRRAYAAQALMQGLWDE